jgi:NAD(P)-dependent dehydrogenase (short-subunit alcohol dehydrogenase family)
VSAELDLTDPRSIEACADAIAEFAGTDDLIVVFCASGFLPRSRFGDPSATIEAVTATFGGNVALTGALLQRDVRLLSLTYVISVGAITLDPSKSSAAHVASKAAIRSFAHALDLQLDDDGPRITVVAPSTFAKPGREGVEPDLLAKGMLDRATVRGPRRGLAEWVVS